MATVHAVQPHTRPERVTCWVHRVALGVVLLGCEPKPDDVPTTSPVTASTCEGADGLDRIWTTSRRGELEAALATQPGEWPMQVLSTIDAHLSAERQAWRDTYARACEQQDLKAQRCLDLEAWQLDAVVFVVLDEPAQAALLWAEIDALLRDPSACAGTREPSFDAPPLTPEVGRELMRTRLLLNLRAGAPLDEAVRALMLVEPVAKTPAYALQLHAIRAFSAFRASRIDEAAAALATATTLAEQLGPRARMSLAHVRAMVAFGRGDV
jgi:hypothetical protein